MISSFIFPMPEGHPAALRPTHDQLRAYRTYYRNMGPDLEQGAYFAFSYFTAPYYETASALHAHKKRQYRRINHLPHIQFH
jgi:hypothetical protein